MSFILSGKLDKRYNWVDAKKIAEVIFNDSVHELNWAEDACNLLMFNTVVNEKNIVQNELGPAEKGDVLIWQLTLYQFYFDYQCIIGEERAYYDHDVGLSGYATYRSASLFENISMIDDAEKWITKYLWNEVFEELNNILLDGEAPKQDFYSIENESFSFSGEEYEIIYHTEREIENDSVAKKVLLKEIELRRAYFTEKILAAFNNDDSKICEFLTNRHWVEHYSDYELKKLTIESAYAFKIKVFKKEGITGLNKYVNYKDDYYDNVEEIEDEMNKQLESLDEDYFNTVDYMENFEMEIMDWIDNGMNEL